jgi:Collagen triple helix repeat (20 copies)
LRKSITAGAAITATLALAATAQADTVTTNFDGFTDGSVNNQDGWQAVNPQVDQAVVPVAEGKALRVSNAATFGSFGDMPHSVPVTRPASENDANNVLINEFTIQAPDSYVPGLAVTASPDEGRGSRMSRVRFEDRGTDGVHVLFADATFEDQDIATLDRSVPHNVKIETTFVKGDDNDVVRVFIDGEQMVRGGSWENYYREFEERNPSASDRLLLRTAGVAAPLTFGNGFLFDDVTTTSTHVNNPAPLNPPAPGPAGPKGDDGQNGADGTNGNDGVNGTNGVNGKAGKAGVNGKNGANGKDGVTAILPVREAKLFGNRMRTIHAPSIKGWKFVKVGASLRGKRLHAHHRTIKVDLRNKGVGTYNVRMTMKYKDKRGAVHTVRSIRTLSITRS